MIHWKRKASILALGALVAFASGGGAVGKAFGKYGFAW